MKSHQTTSNEETGKAAANQPFSKKCASLFSPNSNFPIQPKLTINAPGDVYEQEADKVADQVMQMPLSSARENPFQVSPLQRLGTGGEGEKKMKTQGSNTDGPAVNDDLENYVGNLNGGGQSLPDDTRSFYESRFGFDFGNVRVHTDSVAAKSARSINALAYTSGNNIVFNEGQYSPGTDSGKRLLGHELTHVVQQAGSPGLAMRRQMIVQRSIDTWGGTWDTEYYNDAVDKDQNGSATPPAQGVRGVDIKIKFTPGTNADAEQIGLTQSVQAYVNNSLALTPAASTRAIPAADAVNINTGPGETDAGTAIDRASGFNNPIYPVQTTASTSLADANTSAGWGQLGWRYTGATPPVKDATLIDTPRRVGAQKDSRHIFETTALATKGVQTNTYYGSVRWGWRTDDKGNFSKLPLEVVSRGVPSSTFMKAGQIWNTSKLSNGDETVDLPIVNVKVTTSPITDVATPSTPLTSSGFVLPANTRVQVIFGGASTATGEQPPRIRVVDGIFTGRVLSISLSDMLSLRDERP